MTAARQWLRHVPSALIGIASRQPGLVLFGAGVLMVTSGVTASRLGVDSDLLALLPSENTTVRDFATTVERFGSADIVLIVVSLEGGSDAAEAFADLLAERVQASGLVDWVEHRTDLAGDLAGPLLDHALLFLEPEEAHDLLASLDRNGLRGFARRARGRLITVPTAAGLLRQDPLQLLPRILERVGASRPGGKIGSDSGYLVDPGGSLLLMIAKPARPAADLAFSRRLVTGLEAARRLAVSDWRDAGFEGRPPRVEVGRGPVVAVEDSRLIVRDLVVGSITSTIAVLLLFLIAFRRVGTIVYAILPLVTGIVLTFALAHLLLDRINSLTASCGALLMGLGVDFVVVLYGRYSSERAAGLDHEHALERLGGHTAASIAIGAVTTAASFLAFLIVDFPGLYELGLLTGAGILLIAAAALVLVPALLSLGPGRGRDTRHRGIAGFGADRLCWLSLHHPRTCVATVALLAVVAATAMSGLRFDDDVAKLRSAANRGTRVQREVAERFGLRFSPLTVRVDGPDEDDVVARSQALLPALRSLVERGVLAGIDTVADAVPPLVQQQQILDELTARQVDVDRVCRDLETELHAQGLDPKGFEEGFTHLRRALSVEAPVRLSDLVGTPLEPVVTRCLWVGPDRASMAISCYPPAARGREGAPAELVQAAHDGGAIVTGPVVVSAELRRAVWREAPRAAALGLALVVMLLIADLGRVRDGLLALLPLAAGVVIMLGLMAICGLTLNLLNTFVLTMILGIAVDYGVHILHRHRESAGSGEAVAETARAIAVAALTTVAGFGSLALSSFPGLRSMGLAVILGATASALVAVSLLPAMLQLLEPGHTGPSHHG